MNRTHKLTKDVMSALDSHTDLTIIQQLHLGQTRLENELVMFVKPEVFAVNDSIMIERFVDLTLTKLVEFNVVHSGVVLVGGKALEEKQSMDKHYGAINVLSRSASKVLDAKDRGLVYEALSLPTESFPILGGHEFMAMHPDFTPYSLDDFWRTKKSKKIRSGFYVQQFELNDERFILVNGFHPVQLAHFTDHSHHIMLLLLHSDTRWSTLRNTMIGDTFPERAEIGSIRQILYANKNEFGFDRVSISNNGVHLSAGPFEAMFETYNLFGSLLNLDFTKEPPLIQTKMREKGLSLDAALNTLNNPDLTVAGSKVDLFSATELVDTNTAVDLYWRAKLRIA